MGLLDLLRGKGMDAYVAEAAQVGATLLDVREPSEFKGGHVKDALNIPVGNIRTAEKKLPDKDAPLYVYCQSGGRSSRACSALKSMGYTNVTNIGGIGSYHGDIVRGK